ncbi:hypothetical protein ROHU_029917 [Labeo rohita]|uniref:Uncharacterized protein n=1 Tax=Labeo rohita TaxID=84645 RepID=A0A498LTI1_LABRO|nr:hypothetical protein ROHU_029917 [Labeo rohita]
MKFERRSWCTYQRRTFQKLRMCMAMFPTLTFHHLRYGPAGVTLSARETLTACASSDCLQMIQKPCAFI